MGRTRIKHTAAHLDEGSRLKRRRGRTRIKIAAALVVVASVCGVGAVGSMRASARAATANVDDVRAVYSRHCAKCHGENGDADTEKGELYGATDFTSKRWWDKEHPSDARLSRSIRVGKTGGMPAFGRRLSAAEITALVAYVRGFKSN
jgi:mono/diheme cytochrome c family protein